MKTLLLGGLLGLGAAGLVGGAAWSVTAGDRDRLRTQAITAQEELALRQKELADLRARYAGIEPETVRQRLADQDGRLSSLGQQLKERVQELASATAFLEQAKGDLAAAQGEAQRQVAAVRAEVQAEAQRQVAAVRAEVQAEAQRQVAAAREEADKQVAEAKAAVKDATGQAAGLVGQLKGATDKQLAELKAGYERQIAQLKAAAKQSDAQQEQQRRQIEAANKTVQTKDAQIAALDRQLEALERKLTNANQEPEVKQPRQPTGKHPGK